MTMGTQNCYAYACGYTKDLKLQPGELGGRLYKSTDRAELTDAACADGLDPVLGHTPPMLKAGEHLVALMTSSSDTDAYHWLRRIEDGSGDWSHKLGALSPTKLDSWEKPINDATNPPHTVDLDYDAMFKRNPSMLRHLDTARIQGWATNYDIFVGYFKCPDDFPKIRGNAKLSCNCMIV
ncbi:hypothetical protein [Pelagibius sp. Alg239-R121]|uniref:hypothetical protein n=1 Tax=Pelagibius sp. Alg239-R121 TaxID=2993448 RepID=UPI0024A6DCA1|nr:hypothetical protein [Pelagibius sp. Alg239-R121]